jgi:hypothetical protein
MDALTLYYKLYMAANTVDPWWWDSAVTEPLADSERSEA